MPLSSRTLPLVTRVHFWPVTGLLALTLLSIAGCATAAHVDEYPNQKRMIGKPKATVLACAGKPVKEQTRNDVTVLNYYREAPVLEESQPVGKGSVSTVRHGCWATVYITDNRVADVRYRFAPPTFDASDECEKIFESCPQ